MKYLMNDISLGVASREYFSSGMIAIYPGILCIVGLLSVCAMPIQQGWNDADMIYCRVIPLVAVVGTACCVKTKSYLRFGLTDILALLLYGCFIIRYYSDGKYPAESMAIHATLALCLYFSLRLIFDGTRISGKTVALMILLYAVYEAGYGIVQLLSGASRHDLYPVTGSFHNPGPYSAILVMGIVMAIMFQRHILTHKISEKPREITSLGFMTFAIMFASIIVITMSRTAFIAAILCMFVLFWGRMGRSKWIVLGISILLCAGLYFVKVGSADGRMIINYIGFHAFSDNPLFGCGIGGFFHKFSETTRYLTLNGSILDLNSVDVIDFTFNDWLHIAVELGLIGVVLTVAVAINVAFNLWRSCQPLCLVLLVIFVFSLFSYPLELLPYRIIVIVLVSFSASQRKKDFSRLNRNGIYIFLTVVTSIVAIVIPLSCGGLVKKLKISEQDYNMMRGIEEPALIKDYDALLPLLEENRNFLFDFGRILAKAGRYNDSNDILRRGSLVSNDPMFLIIQGNNYREMEAFDKADEMYLKAWRTMPNRIYPLYRLMKLYEEIGNAEISIEYAKIIIDFKEKIPSPAVRDIKREALEIINDTGI